MTRRTPSGRGMAGLLEARPEKSTQEFALRTIPKRNRILKSQFQFRTEMNGNPLQRIKAGASEARDAWFSQCGKMLIQDGFLTKSHCNYPLIRNPYSLASSLALRLLLGRHAVPLAKQRKNVQDNGGCAHRAICGGGLGIWLQCGHRVVAAAPASASPDTCPCKSDERA